jgi:hypothetical protein
MIPTAVGTRVCVRLGRPDRTAHPLGAVIPSKGVRARVEESRLRDPSTHSVRSG